MTQKKKKRNKEKEKCHLAHTNLLYHNENIFLCNTVEI